MKYLKSFTESQGNYSQVANNQRILQATPSISGNVSKKPKNDGELLDEDELDITLPTDVEITGHKQTPTRKLRTRKLSKEPNVRNC
jgi:hypothetical protein